MSKSTDISKKKIVAITLPHCFEDETVICNSLFARGLERLHLRKPDSSEEVYEEFIGTAIPSKIGNTQLFSSGRKIPIARYTP